MNNFTNKIFTKVVEFAQASGAIMNVIDKLLSRMLPEEDAAAGVIVCGKYWSCPPCIYGQKRCKTTCCLVAWCWEKYQYISC